MAVGTSSVAVTTGIRVATHVVSGDGKFGNTSERVGIMLVKKITKFSS